eukprot:jgi/Bigna1/125979/aug1.1_g687
MIGGHIGGGKSRCDLSCSRGAIFLLASGLVLLLSRGDKRLGSSTASGSTGQTSRILSNQPQNILLRRNRGAKYGSSSLYGRYTSYSPILCRQEASPTEKWSSSSSSSSSSAATAGFHHLKTQTFRNLTIDRQQPPEQIQALIRPLLDYKDELSERELGFLIKAAGLNGLRDLADEILELARREGKANVITYNTAISTMRADGDVPRAVALLEKMIADETEPNAGTYVTILGACENACDAKQAEALLKDLEVRNVLKDISVYRGALNVFAKTGDWKNCVQILREMDERDDPNAAAGGVLPDEAVYNQVIEACMRHGKAEGLKIAEALLEEFEEKGLRWNEDTYAQGIQLLTRTGAVTQAINLFEEAPYRTTGIYNAVLKAYSAQKRNGMAWEAALGVFSDMLAAAEAGWVDKGRKERVVKPTHVTYNLITGILGGAGKWQIALQLFDDSMPSMKVRPNAYNYVSILSAVSRYGMWETSLDLLNRMQQDKSGVKPVTAAYNSVIRAIARAPREGTKRKREMDTWQHGVVLLEDMSRRRVQRDAICMVESIRMFGAYGQLGRALDVLQDFEANEKFRSDRMRRTHAYNAALEASFLSFNWQQALRVVQQMNALKVEDNFYTYETMVSGLSVNAQWERAVQVGSPV